MTFRFMEQLWIYGYVEYKVKLRSTREYVGVFGYLGADVGESNSGA